jgi:hypothetical protein
VAGKKLGEPDKTLVRFAQERAGLSVARMSETAQRIAAGLEATSTRMTAFGRARPEFGARCADMARQWAVGSGYPAVVALRRANPRPGARACPARDASRRATR